MNSTRLSRLVLGTALLGPALVAHAGDFVAISSTASPRYIRPLDTSGRPAPALYVFTQGRFFESATVDRRLAKTTFLEVAQKLAPALAKQNYLPARNADVADLVIMVHWGSTLIYEDPQKDTRMDALNSALTTYRESIDKNGIADPGVLNEISSDLAAGQSNANQAIARNAVLLGYAQTLEKFRTSGSMLREEERTLRLELNEERYFVVLMAYDNAGYKAKKPRLLWVTRLSTRSAGTNFTEALPVLGEAGARVYGQQMDHLARVKGKVRSGEVIIGEMRSLGPTDEKKQ